MLLLLLVWPSSVLQVLDAALALAELDRSALRFEKQLAPTVGILPRVSEVLKDPLLLWEAGREARQATERWDDLLGWVARNLELMPPDSRISPIFAPAEQLLKVWQDARTAINESGLPAVRAILPGLYMWEERSFAGQAVQEAIPWPELDQVDWPRALRAALRVVQTAVSLAQEFPDASAWEPPRRPFRLCWLQGTPASEVHRIRCPETIIVDPGGDDVYIWETTGSHVILDFGGNDLYRGPDASVASGWAGWGVIVDFQGSDRYEGGHGSLATGLGGVGLLWDWQGADAYRAKTIAIAAGVLGAGILRDDQGNDLYQVDAMGEAFAGYRGIGVLVDRQGADVYLAGRKYLHKPLYADAYRSLAQGFAIGLRYEERAGGIAVLYDASGNDLYSGQVYCQGAGYWYALGMLLDGEGHDAYNCHIYGQGAGIHLAAGLLWDAAGNDGYYMNDGVGMGGAHDLAVALLVEEEGNDYYAGAGITQGAGNANGVGILVDLKGNDAYAAAKETVQGGARPARGFFSIGILLDLGGRDFYTAGLREGARSVNGFWGIAWDAE